jgi:ATP-dependent helicase HrpA
VPPELMRATPRDRLDHLARYLRAIHVRLQRLPNDPPKDQTKAAQVVPLWQRYVERRNAWVTRGRSTADLDEFGWMIEELRVSVFAPELRTAVPVSTKALTELWATLPA